ncbi:MAG TPA: carboxypeptidase-like regulatory domain-containing protein [Candidatus Angelobacter sp.]
MRRTGVSSGGPRTKLLVRSIFNFVLGLGASIGLTFLAPPAFAQVNQPSAPLAATRAPVDQQPPDQQLTGSISGTVVDKSGAVVVGARVTLMGADQFPPQDALSGEFGQFSFAGVFPGSFRIRIAAAGFSAQVFSGTLHPGEAYLAPPSSLAPAAVSTTVQVTVSQTELAQEQVKAQEKQRIVGVFPNFYVSYVPDAVPLSPKQKFQLAWKTTIDPVTFALVGVSAGVQQAQNDFSGYGQGALGYAKRFGATYTDEATSTFLGSALLPSLLKQDPRYFYKGSGSKVSRTLYAIANSVICKGDNGRWQPNYSAILGGLASGAISNLYYPPKDRGVALVFESTAIGTAETAVLNILQEFLLKKFTPNAQKQSSSQTTKGH